MGLFDIFKKKKNKEIPQEVSEIADSNREARKVIRLSSQTERVSYIKDNCEMITESMRQIEDAKKEYQAVTSYLTDMQKIDMIPLEQRAGVVDAARNISNLTKERNKLQNRSSLLSDRQYRLFERYELQLPKEMHTMKENERYQLVIEQDIAHLENEREAIEEEQDEIISKQSFLKGIAITTSIVIIILFLLFGYMSVYSEINLTLPFLLTVLMGMACILYIFMEARKNVAEISKVQAKQNRQILLMNKVKIKSVNNRNFLDYAYNKYMVDNYAQLKKYWEEYIRLKDEARRYQKSTDLLEFYNKELIRELKKFGIHDAEIWIFQTNAILDNKEMAEVRHRLNVRRQKLRERIDVNTRQKEDALKEINNIKKTYPEVGEEAVRIMRRYRIESDTE